MAEYDKYGARNYTREVCPLLTRTTSPMLKGRWGGIVDGIGPDQRIQRIQVGCGRGWGWGAIVVREAAGGGPLPL